MSMLKLFSVCALAVAALALAPTDALAQGSASISLTTDPANSVRPNQQVTATGRLTIGGKPVANAPVVLFIRPAGGPDRAVATVTTDANGRYCVSGAIPSRPGQNVQVAVVSGGAPQNVARAGKVLDVR